MISPRFRSYWPALVVTVTLTCVAVAPSIGVAETEAEPGTTVVIPLNPETGRPFEVAERFRFHLYPYEPPHEVVSYPCGIPFVLPTGRFAGWVEGPGRLSGLMVLNHAATADPGAPQHRFRIDAFPAGSVAVDTAAFDGAGRESLDLRLLQLDPLIDGRLQQEFARRVPLSSAEPSFQMPVGRAVAAVVDRDTGEHVRLARPVRVVAGKTVTAELSAPPRGRAALVARVDRMALVSRPSDDDVQVSLTGAGGESRPPAVLSRAAGRLYAFWYDLTPGRWTLAVTARGAWAPEMPLDLEERTIRSVTVPLQAPARLHGSLVLPEELDVDSAVLRVISPTEGNEHLALELDRPFPPEVTLQPLPRLPVEVVLELGPWRFSEPADLRAGEASVLIAPELAHVSGRVTVDEEGVAAVVGFLTNRSTQGEEVASEHETDGDGRFEAVLVPEGLQPVVLVTVEGREPLWWALDRAPVDGDVIDIELAGGPVDVRVVDAETSEGIAGAEVGYGWQGPRGGGRMTLSGADGSVRLPPVPESQLRVIVRAEGYRPADRLVDLEAEGEETITIPLQPENGETAVRFLLPNGAPASGAEVAILASAGADPRWSGTADGDGIVHVPEIGAGEILAAVHPQAGAAVVLGEPRDGADVRMPPPGGDLRVQAVDPGGAPVPFAPVVLWLGDLRLSGPSLQWVARSPVMTLRDGSWTARNLPAQPVGVLVVARSADDGGEALAGISSGAYDYRRAQLPHPWPAPAQVEAVLP